MDSLISHTLSGASFGALLFLLAGGLTVTFGLMRVVNLAHGGFYVIGGYVASDLLGRSIPYWYALILAVLIAAVIGAVVEVVILRRMHGRELTQVVATVGVAFVIADQLLNRYGGREVLVPRPPGLGGTVQLTDGVTFPVFRLAMIGFALLVWLVLLYLMKKTRLGMMVRSTVDDPEIARATGVPVTLLSTCAFAFGSGLAALAGVLGGAFGSGLAPGTEWSILLLAFVVVVVGGLGSVNGAFLAAILVGLVDEYGKVLVPSLAAFMIYGPTVLLLAVRPHGLLGAKTS